jgi:hypothetical protein
VVPEEEEEEGEEEEEWEEEEEEDYDDDEWEEEEEEEKWGGVGRRLHMSGFVLLPVPTAKFCLTASANSKVLSYC